MGVWQRLTGLVWVVEAEGRIHPVKRKAVENWGLQQWLA